jgi:hypothetical protein
MIPPHNKTTIVAKPGESSFDFPASSVSSQRASILPRVLSSSFSVRTYQLNAFCFQPFPQRIRIGRLIINEARHLLFRVPGMLPGNRDSIDHFLYQGHFCRRGRVQVVSQRNTFAVDHHHPLCSLSLLGWSDAEPPFLAGAKLPSAKHSDHSSICFLSSSPRNDRHAFNHTSCPSHSRNRRQHVVGEGNLSGRSFHRAPLRRTHKIPSKTSRLGMGFGPPRAEALGGGK